MASISLLTVSQRMTVWASAKAAQISILCAADFDDILLIAPEGAVGESSNLILKSFLNKGAKLFYGIFYKSGVSDGIGDSQGYGVAASLFVGDSRTV